MSRTVRTVAQLFLLLTLAFTAVAQKGKPSACPSPPPLPTGDSRCFLANSGCIDPNFGIGGITSFFAPLPYTGVSIEQIAVQPWDSKIVAVGSFHGTSETTYNSGLVFRFDPDGSLDKTFGDADPNNPLMRLGYLIDGNVNRSVAIQSDGYIIAGGEIQPWGGWSIRRYTPDGQIDTSFGSGGLVATGSGLFVSGLAVQSDGKILAVGGDSFRLMRLLPDGTPDPGFGNAGLVIANPSSTSLGSGTARSLAIQRFEVSPGHYEERIVAAGYGKDATTRKQQNDAYERFALMRFRPNGSIDTSFDIDGRVMTDFFGRVARIFRIVVDLSNRIVATGQVHPSSCPDSPDAGFARYNPNGGLDSTFSGDGKANIDVYGYSNYNSDLLLQTIGSEEKIVGLGFVDYGSTAFTIIRLNDNGNPDSSFGPGTYGPGRVTLNEGPYAFWSYGALQPDNKIVFAGRNDSHFRLARYLP